MLSNSVVLLSVLAQLAAAQVHGSSAKGTMGPVAFLWPADRAWDGAHDNTGPCGSTAGIVNRTSFPIGALGTIETTIADEAYNMAIRIAYGNNPTTQDQFTAVKGNVSSVEPGHQCYSIPTDASTLSAGTNATIQLEYWGNDSGKDESFFACADITFVDVAAFTEQVMCFNVTSTEFTANDPSSTAAVASPTAAPTGAATAEASAPVVHSAQGSSGLSGGAKAGIAIGAIVGAALILGVGFLAIRRKRSVAKDAEVAPPMGKIITHDAVSIGSAQTAK